MISLLPASVIHQQRPLGLSHFNEQNMKKIKVLNGINIIIILTKII